MFVDTVVVEIDAEFEEVDYRLRLDKVVQRERGEVFFI